jgi:hypothetical protein
MVVIASFAVLASSLALWSRRTVLNSEKFADQVGDVIDDPRVQDALAAFLTNEVVTAIDPQQVAERLLPDQASALARPLAVSLEQLVRRQADELVSSADFQDRFVGLVERAHRAALQLLEGNEVRGVSIQGDEVIINLVPVIADLLRRIGADGLVDRLATLPAFGGDEPPSEQVQAIVDRTGIQLEPDFGQFTVFSSTALTDAQNALELFKKLTVLLVIVTALIIAATIALSPTRRRTIVQLGIGVAAAMVLAYVIVRWVQNRLVDRVAEARSDRADGVDVVGATKAITGAFIDNLGLVVIVVTVLGIAAAFVAFIVGPSSTAVSIRGHASQLAGRASTSGASSKSGEFIQTHRDGLRFTVVIAALVVLLWLGLSLGGLITALLVAAIGLLAIDWFVRRRQPAPPEPA